MSVDQHKEMGNSRSKSGEEYAKKHALKRRSDVWDHFTFNKVTKRAICNHCKEDLQGDSKKGTSHLKRHLLNFHPREYASTDFQSSIEKITAEDTTVFGASSASTSSDKKRAPLTGEPMEDDHVVGKQARLNKEKQLKGPIKESGVIPQQNILTGENNKLTVEHSDYLALQIQNGSSTKFGEALKIFVSERSQLIEQNHQLETQIKEHKEELDRAGVATREQAEARFAAENKVSALTLELAKLHNEKARIKESLQIQNDSNLELGEALQISVSERSQLIEQNHQLDTQIKDYKEALDRARVETRKQTEARFAAENKVSALILECDKLGNGNAQIKEALDRAREETKEARVVAEQKVSDLNKKCDDLKNENVLLSDLLYQATTYAGAGGGGSPRRLGDRRCYLKPPCQCILFGPSRRMRCWRCFRIEIN